MLNQLTYSANPAASVHCAAVGGVSAAATGAEKKQERHCQLQGNPTHAAIIGLGRSGLATLADAVQGGATGTRMTR